VGRRGAPLASFETGADAEAAHPAGQLTLSLDAGAA
jgi:hypothetical protein